ncbi:MAG: ECF transporter S component [Prevotella sp.]
MQNTARIQTLSPADSRTYAITSLFVAGNIILPYLCHMIPDGGKMFLPIFFFTLVGAYRYGMTVGLATAVLSPIMNSLLTGRPDGSMLPPMLVQSVMLAVAAAAVAHRARRVSTALIAAVVIACQMVGLIIERLMTSPATTLAEAFLTAIPGMLIQILAGTYLIRKL